MLIDRDIGPLSIAADDTIEAALRQITLNRRRAVYCVDTAGVVVGVITDGDFRRWLLAHPGASLATPAVEVANTDFVVARFDAPRGQVEKLFSDSILTVPLTDDRKRLIAVARPRTRSLWIGERLVDGSSPAFIVAEIGINHNGSVTNAKRLVDEAAGAGAECAKFQMRDLGALYRDATEAGCHCEDLGAQYTLDLLRRFSLSVEEMIEVLEHCRSVGLIPMCTPWDLPSAHILAQLDLPAFKVASADLTNHELLAALAETARPIVMSTGMSTEEEVLESVGLLRTAGAPYALLHCNSTYPAPFKDLNLRYIRRLADIGDCTVGYSGHERGYHVPIAAVAQGAKVIEKHFTLDRTWEGSDHQVSLEPDEFAQMVTKIREVEDALGLGETRTITQGELMNRVSLAKSLVAGSPITAGDQITDEMVEVRSPGRGLQPNQRHRLVGRRARRNMAPGDFFYPGDLVEDAIDARSYSFGRRWGIPVRFHDYRELATKSNPDFLEFHLSYRDLELPVDEMLSDQMPLGLVVHAPDLYRGDHILNLAADSRVDRERSIAELQRVIDITRRLAPHFDKASHPLIVASLGGVSFNAPIARAALPTLYDRILMSLDQVDHDGTEIIAQTLPPFPWYLGGQRYCNLFVDPDETSRFARSSGMRLCLDVAHTQLACNHLGRSFADAVEVLAPVAAHLHIVDAAGAADEGLQIGDGEVDFRALARQLDRLAPDAGFIPEIWQGHQNGGEGFWVALDRLEGLF